MARYSHPIGFPAREAISAPITAKNVAPMTVTIASGMSSFVCDGSNRSPTAPAITLPIAIHATGHAQRRSSAVIRRAPS